MSKWDATTDVIDESIGTGPDHADIRINWEAIERELGRVEEVITAPLREQAVAGWRTALLLAVQYGAKASERAAREALAQLAAEP